MAVSVLIVNFRSYAALATCLATLEPQLEAGDEIIVVDHASNERALGAARGRHASVQFIPVAGNPGFAAGINHAARHASGDLLLLVNPDVMFDGPVVQAMQAHFTAHPYLGAAGPRLLNADGSVQPSARGFPNLSTVFGGRTTWLTKHFPDNWLARRNLIGRSATSPTGADWVSGACLMTPRALFERLGGLDERFFMYWEDADYCRRAQAAGRRTVYLPEFVAVHVGGGSSVHDLPGAMRVFHESAFKYYWKHAGIAGRLLAPFAWVGLRARGLMRMQYERRRQ